VKTRYAAIFAAILVAYAAYAAVTIWMSSTVFDGERFFVLPDDPMISMRYARNLAAGHGLVWNAGEQPVEGYSNLLWVLMMAGVHELPLALSKTSAVVQAVCAGLLLANLWIVRRLALASGADEGTAIAAVFLTAFFFPLNGWGLGGFEVALLMPLMEGALLAAVQNLDRGRFSRLPYWLLGLATLVRLDAAVVYLAALLALAAQDRPHRRRHLIDGLLLLAIFVLGQTLFRVNYYGDWLPNTYYLKMTGYPVTWRIAWGLRYLATYVWHRNWFLFLLAGFALVRARPPVVLLAATAAAQFAYAVYAGSSDNRFTTTIAPVVFVLFALGVRNLGRLIAPALPRAAPWAIDRSGVIFAGAMVLSLLAFDVGWEGFQRADSTVLLERARVLEELTTPIARVAVVSAGALPYFLDRPAVDMLGKNDHFLAREPAHPPFTSFSTPYVSGHVKWDYPYSIGNLQPDVVIELWRTPEEAVPSLDAYRTLRVADQMLYLRRDSTRIRWDRVARYDAQPQ
jgi:arabinofuranosyltransferase